MIVAYFRSDDGIIARQASGIYIIYDILIFIDTNKDDNHMPLSQHRGMSPLPKFAHGNAAPAGLKKISLSSEAARQNPSISRINLILSRLHLPREVNESVIEDILAQLDNCATDDLGRHQLLTARILEATLICASHYVDNCEFTAAGDLLFNPRQILIHCKNRSHPETKIRHGRLSEQMSLYCPTRGSFPQWFRHNAALRITKPALIPELLQRIEQFRTFHNGYLASIHERMKKAADAIGFLSAWHLAGWQDLYRRKQSASAQVRSTVSENLCRFDNRDFIRLGLEIELIARRPGYQSVYLTA